MNYKLAFLALIFSLISSTGYTQKTISALDIMQDIKDGKSISLNNAVISGVLDFTYMNEAIENLPKTKKNSWWNSGKYDNTIKKNINVNIVFTNCTFKDDVLAYIPDEDSGYTFIAHFENVAIFKNCNFKRKAMFKYSRFEKDSNFSGSSFEEDSTFKYAKFNKSINFTNTIFEEVATFKYAKFNKKVSFSKAIFKDSAIFKYTEFKNGVSFVDTTFEEDLNIKYMNVTGDFNISNMKVEYDIDSKYTKINGSSFSKYLIDKK